MRERDGDPAGERTGDPVADLLRGALRREADAVRPSPDGLARIRAAVGSDREDPFTRRRRSVLRRFAPAVAAAAAVLAVGLGGALLLRPGALHGAQPAASLVENRPTPAVVQPLPVYFVEERNGVWALVREFEPTTQTDPTRRLEQALRAAVAGRATDPDYTSVWRLFRMTGEVSARIGERPVVTLSSGLVGHADLDASLAHLAVQQLVWTATATLQQVSAVTIQAQSGASRLFDIEAFGAYERESGARDPRAPVWISSLTDGQDLRVGTATVTGDGLAGLDDVTWTLLRIAGAPSQIVAQGRSPLLGDDGRPAVAGQRGTWTVHLTLAEQGMYQLVVEQRGADRPWSDTKAFRVR